MTRPRGRRTIRSTVGTLRGMLQVNEHERAVMLRMGVSVTRCRRSQSPKQGDVSLLYIVGGGGIGEKFHTMPGLEASYSVGPFLSKQQAPGLTDVSPAVRSRS